MDSNLSNTDMDDEDGLYNEKTPILKDENEVIVATQGKTTCYLYLLTFFGALGGFLFGYDTGVISGAMIPLSNHFNLSTEMQELVVSVTIAGAILGAVLSGFLNDRLGRKPVLLLGSFVFVIGSVVMGAAGHVVLLIIGRGTVGLGIGFASSTVPVYIAEAAPPHIRGRLVTVNQLMITFGQFAASVLNGLFSYFQDGWRYMLGFAGIPSFIMFVGFIFMPESPRWLVTKGKTEQASLILFKLRGTHQIEAELESIKAADQATKEQEGTNYNRLWRALSTPHVRKALLLGCGLQAIQQLSAINTVMYYSATIIKLAGVESEQTIIWLAAAVASGNFFFTLISMYLVEKIGRRKLTLSSVAGVVLALLVLSGTFYVIKHQSPKSVISAPTKYSGDCSKFSTCYNCMKDTRCGFCYVTDTKSDITNGSCLLKPKSYETASPFCNETKYPVTDKSDLNWASQVCPTEYASLAVFAMIFYLGMFAPGLGPMPWAVNAEIYPLWARSIGTGASTATNWLFNLMVSLTFLNLTELLTKTGTFLLYAAFTLCGLLFLAVLMPETKGKRLEEVEDLFKGSERKSEGQ